MYHGSHAAMDAQFKDAGMLSANYLEWLCTVVPQFVWNPYNR